MDLKEFLLEGGHIGFPYKESKKDWVTQTYLRLASAMHGLPKVFVDLPSGLKTFPLEELDQAIDVYIDTVLSEKNLWYKKSRELRDFNLRNDFAKLREKDEDN